MAYHHGNLRETLLSRAAAVVASQGVDAVTLRGLARDLGVSHAAPNAHFADRNALLCELAKQGFRRCVEALDRGADDAGDDPVDRYRALGRAYVRFARDNPALFRAISHPDLRRMADSELQELQRTWIAKLRSGAEAAHAAGWHPEADGDALLAFSVAGAMGAAALFADEGWLALFGLDRAGDIERLADRVLDLVVQPVDERAVAPQKTKSASERKTA